MSDVQELSFQNVVDTILKPEGIKVGGFPDDLFLDLTDEEREQLQCNICFMVSRDPRWCNNKHNFCATCVFAWSMTYGANSDKCPVCRIKQQDYAKNKKLESEILYKWVKCPEMGCALRCTLGDFLKHSHGERLYGPSGDLNRLRRNRPAPVGSSLANGLPFSDAFLAQSGGNSRMGRNLLHDMLQVWHMEMELRRRAINRFHSNGDDEARRRHLDEIIAIQTHIMEISYFLNMLFNTSSGQGNPFRFLIGMGAISSRGDDDDSSSESSDSTEPTESTYRPHRVNTTFQPPLSTTRVSGNRNATGLSDSTYDTQTAAIESSSIRPRTDNNHHNINNSQHSNEGLSPPTHANNISNNAVSRLRNNVEIETVQALDGSPTSSDTNNNFGQLLPSSSTFQTTVEQLPPITRSNSVLEEPTEDSIISNGLALQPQPVTQPERTAAPHRRPAPPTTPGPAINTVRTRRRTTATNNPNTSTNTPLQRPTPTRTSNINRTNAARPRARVNPNLPSTSGALLRARRRSEIQQQLMHNAEDSSRPDNQST